MDEITVLPPRRVVSNIARVLVGSLEVTHESLDLLEELQSIGDGFFERVLINDIAQGKDLEARGLACRSNRGSYSAGPKLSAWLKEHQTAVYLGLADSAALGGKDNE